MNLSIVGQKKEALREVGHVANVLQAFAGAKGGEVALLRPKIYINPTLPLGNPIVKATPICKQSLSLAVTKKTAKIR